MSGIDFMTIAAWVGHKDGGVLIGKVYGHLANEHRKAMAGRMNFEPGPTEIRQILLTCRNADDHYDLILDTAIMLLKPWPI